MKVNPEKLQQSLLIAIAEINKRPKHITKTIKEMALHMFNMTGGEIVYILNGRTPVDTMSEDTLYKTTKILYEYFSSSSNGFEIESLNVDNYFFEEEQKKYNKKINRKIVDADIVKDKYVPISKDQFIIKFTNKELAYLASINKIHYNPETQRALTTIETKNGSYQKVTINPEAYNDIYIEMESDDYIPDMLTFNINPDSSEQPKIIDDKIIIPKESIIDCIDGYHRLKAAIALTRIKENWEITFPIMLTGFDVKKSKRYILQQDKKTHLTQEQITEDNQDDAANFIISKLNDSEYFKYSNLQNKSYQLNKIINSIFSPNKLKSKENIQSALILFKRIEKEMNTLIEENIWIGKDFSIKEWFIYLYLINYSWNNTISFLNIIKDIDIKYLLEKISITNEPTPKHYKIMREVLKNV